MCNLAGIKECYTKDEKLLKTKEILFSEIKEKEDIDLVIKGGITAEYLASNTHIFESLGTCNLFNIFSYMANLDMDFGEATYRVLPYLTKVSKVTKIGYIIKAINSIHYIPVNYLPKEIRYIDVESFHKLLRNYNADDIKKLYQTFEKLPLPLTDTINFKVKDLNFLNNKNIKYIVSLFINDIKSWTIFKMYIINRVSSLRDYNLFNDRYIIQMVKNLDISISCVESILKHALEHEELELNRFLHESIISKKLEEWIPDIDKLIKDRTIEVKCKSIVCSSCKITTSNYIEVNGMHMCSTCYNPWKQVALDNKVKIVNTNPFAYREIKNLLDISTAIKYCKSKIDTQ